MLRRAVRTVRLVHAVRRVLVHRVHAVREVPVRRVR
jgi:hypothetical protein